MPLFSSKLEFDLRQLAAVQQQRKIYLSSIEDARTELLEFRRRVEALPPLPELNPHERKKVFDCIDPIYQELNLLATFAERMQPIQSKDDYLQQLELRSEASTEVARISKSLDNLPAYYVPADWAESLQKQHRRSEQLLQWLAYGTVIVAVISIGLVTCGFQWISVLSAQIPADALALPTGDSLSPATCITLAG